MMSPHQANGARLSPPSVLPSARGQQPFSREAMVQSIDTRPEERTYLLPLSPNERSGSREGHPRVQNPRGSPDSSGLAELNHAHRSPGPQNANEFAHPRFCIVQLAQEIAKSEGVKGCVRKRKGVRGCEHDRCAAHFGEPEHTQALVDGDNFSTPRFHLAGDQAGARRYIKDASLIG